MAQTKHKMPPYIKQAIIWLCRGYYDAADWANKNACRKGIDEGHYNFRLVRAVDRAMCNIGSDIVNFDLRRKLREAIWESTLNGRAYPYEVWDLPTIYRDDFYERRRKFIKEIAVNMKIIQDGE